MKERPILFSGAMVRAILEGRKTQTRRIVKPQPHDGCGRIWCAEYSPTVIDRWGDEQPGKEVFGAYSEDGEWGVRCPYGQPGDRLWVRETWGVLHEHLLNDQHEPTFWRADYNAEDFATQVLPRWRPSIHMPRSRSRIKLELTGVRVERLQDISQGDAIAEGAPPSHSSIDAVSRDIGYADFSRSWYAQLWDQINGPGSWEANPLVWVVEFRRVEGGAA